MKNNNFYIKIAALMLVVMIFSCKKDKDNAKPEPEPLTITDVEGNVYKTVKIGNQVWMAENLKVAKLKDDTPISRISVNTEWANCTSPAYCGYANSQSNFEEYGALYNWYAVNSGKLAPEGWHVPTIEEWESLMDYLVQNKYNYDGSLSGKTFGKAMAANWGWNATSTVGAVGNIDYPQVQNSSGLTLIGAGYREHDGYFEGIGDYACFWVKGPSAYDAANATLLCNDDLYMYKIEPYVKAGLSVRCIKD
jgi:uncharacterized protein (TIGR02145 family)